MDIENGKVDQIEAHAPGTIGQFERQIRASPVKHWHEVVTDNVDAAGRQVAQALSVIVNMNSPVATLTLDVFRNRQALCNIPCQTA